MDTFHVFTADRVPPVPQGYLLVPQTVYKASAGGFVADPPLGFGNGIRLDDAFRQNYSQLPDADAVAEGLTPGRRIALRINWPGYEPWYYHFAVPASAKKGAIATEVARHVQRFLDDMRNNVPAPDAQPWNIARTELADLILLELGHVAKGSRQPMICMRV